MAEALAVQASPNKKLKFTPTSIDRALLIQSQPLADERGYFARVWCQQEFAELGLNTDLVQCNLSHNHQRGTLRGMHYQRAPFEEAKVVRCTQGSIYDVIIDLRSDSPSFMHWQAFELSADNQQMLYIPEGCAHGFQTLTDELADTLGIERFSNPEMGLTCFCDVCVDSILFMLPHTFR